VAGRVAFTEEYSRIERNSGEAKGYLATNHVRHSALLPFHTSMGMRREEARVATSKIYYSILIAFHLLISEKWK
jgi:hypothetical protein